MPHSDHRFNEKIVKWFKKLKGCQKFLDIGAGAGKYSDLIKEAYPNATIDCVEADSSYITQFTLKKKYSKIYSMLIENWIKRYSEVNYDVVILGDVLEHLLKSDGLDVLNFFAYRCKYMLVQWPHNFVQGAWEGHTLETHRSVWGQSDFANFDYEHHKEGTMRLVFVKGFLE